MDKVRAAVFISGRGSNLKALIDACAKPNFPVEIALVVSNNPDAPGLTYANDAGITSLALGVRESLFYQIVDECLLTHQIDLIALAGFMRILRPDFVTRWRDRIINIHPSLLPAFRGLHAQRQALEAGVKWAGCTVHYVVPEVDAGPMIVQVTAPVEPNDTEETLSARILELEHQIYPIGLLYAAQRTLDEHLARQNESFQ